MKKLIGKKNLSFLERAHYRFSFRKRLFAAFLLLTLFSTFFMAAYSAGLQHRELTRRAEENYTQLLSQSAQIFTNEFHQIEQSMKNISSNRSVMSVFQNSLTTNYGRYFNYKYVIDPLVSTLIVNNSNISGVTFYQSNPTLVERGSQVLSISRVESEPWYESIRRGEIVWHRDPETGVLSAFMSIFSYYANRMPSVIEIQVNTDSLFSMASSVSDSFAFCVETAAGDVVYEQNMLPGMRDAYTTGELFQLNGTSYRVFSNDIDTPKCRLNLIVPESEFSIPLGSILLSVMPVVLGCVLFSFLLARIMSGFLSRRIVRLSNQIAMVSQGNLDSMEDTPYQDEIGILTHQFNEMVVAIQESMTSLKQAERKEIEAESAALRTQIAPHFLYNALSVISWNAIEQGAPEVAQQIATLSRYFRTVLNRGESESTLQEEISNVESYLEIQQDMSTEGFEVDIQVPEELYPCVIPNFILQPIVENALFHGIQRKPGLHGTIRITAEKEADMLILSISNDGEPFRRDELEKVLSDRNRGYGLRNVQQRIVYLYGSEYGISLADPEPPFTTCVQLRVRAE